MILVLKISVLVSLMATFALCLHLWAHKKGELPRLLMINLAIYSSWSLLVILTLLTDDLSIKIFLTKIRQVANPFILPIWLMIASIVFYKETWLKYKKWFLLILIIPSIASLGSIASALNFKPIDNLFYYNFLLLPEGQGLLTYEVGPLLNFLFKYQAILLLLVNSFYIFNLFSKKDYLRRFAALFLIGGLVPTVIEVLFRYTFDNKYLLQYGAGSASVLALATYYGVTRLEFLNIKSFARQRMFKLLPNPILTLTPRYELWDTNLIAKELFKITDQDFGKDVRTIAKFQFLFTDNQHVEVNEATFQIFRHEIYTHNFQEQGIVFVLNDISKIIELNRDLSESNETLKELNNEILKITNFNKKVHTVLSHDMTGFLSTVQTLSKMPADSKIMHMIQKASESSIDLLKNVLSWSYTEKNHHEILLSKSINNVIEQLSSHAAEKSIRITRSSTGQHLIYGHSHMVEAIFRNVITNAIKYSPHQSEIRIDSFEQEKYIKIEVSDSGKGIDKQDIENILNHRPTKENSDGYGIGLRFTQEFIQNMKGSFEIISERDRGTTIQIKLPKTR